MPSLVKGKGEKVKVHTLDIAPLRSESPPQTEALRYGTCSRGISQFYLHTHTFIRNRNEPYLPLPSHPQLVLIYRPRRDGRLSRPWCEVAQAEIRTRNLPIANPTLYHTATSAPKQHTMYDSWSRSLVTVSNLERSSRHREKLSRAIISINTPRV